MKSAAIFLLAFMTLVGAWIYLAVSSAPPPTPNEVRVLEGRVQVLEKQNREMWGRIEGLEMITNSKNGRRLPIKVEK